MEHGAASTSGSRLEITSIKIFHKMAAAAYFWFHLLFFADAKWDTRAQVVGQLLARTNAACIACFTSETL
jgi:hypothetical protein